MLINNYDITNLKGAEYNPREISEQSISELCKSIKELGLVKPLIVRKNILVAGHQRTKALRKLGVTQASVYLLNQDTTTYDEVRFNQLHNGTDMDMGEEHARIEGDLPLGFSVIKGTRISGNFRAPMANVRDAIMKLINKYGSWGGIVATQSGEVIHCGQYALSCAILNVDCTVYTIPNSEAQKYKAYLNKQYGEFSYKHLQRNTYIQTFAQLFRLRGKARENLSPTYEKLVKPFIKGKQLSILDFGCGQGDYVKALSKEGIDIIGMEFFRRIDGSNTIDMNAVHKMVDSIFKKLKSKNRFDLVVCDYVMNSVDSLDAEQAVLDTLDALCKPNGHIIFSGRPLERVISENKATKSACKKLTRHIEFLDNDGFSALYRKGHWFYQKFHSQEQVIKLCDERRWKIIKTNQESTSWAVMIQKQGDRITIPRIEFAIEFEFNLCYPSNVRLNRHEAMKEAVISLYNLR